jgi:hypothetical protein
VRTDPGNGTPGTTLELGVGTPTQASSWLLEVPKAQPKKVTLYKVEAGEEVTVATLEFDNFKAEQSGTALVLLAANNGTPEPNTKWSPLP